jgi:hypothetical protein
MSSTTRRRILPICATVAMAAATLAPTATAATLSHGKLIRNTIGTSSNWSGYDSTAGPFTSVSASWTQPSVTCPTAKKNSYSSFWVGLDGDGTSTVEQTGTDSDCIRGNQTYYGWFEMYPAAPVNFTNPVKPGDAMHASVTYQSSTFKLVLTDQTRGWTQTITKSLNSATRMSAEVIAEAPSSGKVLPLADFGTVKFTSALANGTALGTHSPNEIIMASGGTTKATPSALSVGENFSVTWDHS